MADKFNLMELLSKRSKEEPEAERTENEVLEDMPAPEAQKEEVVYIDAYDLIPSKDNFYHVDDELKRSIEIAGILQPLLIKKPENGKYKVIAGHRRRLAILSLLSEGKEEWRFVPCVFKKENVRDRLAIIMANKFRDKTDYEKMIEAIQTEEMARELKKEYQLPGKVREILSELTGQSEAQLGRYKAVFNNLSKEFMELFKANRIGFSVVNEICGLSEEWQEKAMEKYDEKGDLSLQDVKAIKRKQEEDTPVPGQMSMEELEPKSGQQDTPQAESEGEQGEEMAPENEAPEEWVEPKPETVVSLCYECDKWESCHEKKATVTKCNAYVDRKEARLTEEQKYNREQAEIDRETKRKLREQRQEEKMQNLPTDQAKKERCIRISRERYGEITEEGRLTFLLLKKDKYRIGEEITLLEFAEGRATGRTAEITVCYIWEDYTGLDDDYCVLGFDLVSYSE